jgi:hypothetical protein
MLENILGYQSGMNFSSPAQNIFCLGAIPFWIKLRQNSPESTDIPSKSPASAKPTFLNEIKSNVWNNWHTSLTFCQVRNDWVVGDAEEERISLLMGNFCLFSQNLEEMMRWLTQDTGCSAWGWESQPCSAMKGGKNYHSLILAGNRQIYDFRLVGQKRCATKINFPRASDPKSVR